MKIKGKLLLKEGLLKTKVGELVYIAQSSITVYNDGLYLNISDVFFREKIGSFVLPIIRVGSGNEDFEIDMKNSLLIHILAIEKPQKKYGWIGPFPFEFEYYTKAIYWNRFNSVELLEALYKAKLDGKDEDSADIGIIRKRKFIVEFSSYNEQELDKEKLSTEKYFSEVVDVLAQMNEEGIYSDLEIDAQHVIIDELKNDLVVLTEISEKLKEEKKSILFEELTLDEHKKALSDMDLSAEDADYELAARHKNKIEELERAI